MNNGDKPAFPTIKVSNDAYSRPITVQDAAGMTKREVMAAIIMAGASANPQYADCKLGVIIDDAVKVTDALLKALDKKVDASRESAPKV